MMYCRGLQEKKNFHKKILLSGPTTSIALVQHLRLIVAGYHYPQIFECVVKLFLDYLNSFKGSHEVLNFI